MITHDNHATFPGARSGVWHLHHVKAGKDAPAGSQEAKPPVVVTEATAILQKNLAAAGMSAPEPYVWHQGEPLYHGDPIEGRACPSEEKAFAETRKEIATQGELL